VQGQLPTLLHRLSKEMMTRIRAAREDGSVIHARVQYVKDEVGDFGYDLGRGISLSTSRVLVEKQEWEWKHELGLYDAIERVKEEVPDYSLCVSEIGRGYQVTDGQADFWLTQFLQSVAGAAVDAEAGDEFLVDHVATLIRDLDQATLDWNVELWLLGVWLEGDSYVIEDDFLLRRPRPSDFEGEVPFDQLMRQPPSPFPPRTPTAILEFGCRSSAQLDVQLETETVLRVLRLFRLGSVASPRQRLWAKSILTPPTQIYCTSTPATPYQYTLTAVDLDSFRAFLRKMRPLLRHYPAYGPSAHITDAVSIALQRYEDALLLSPATPEARITSAVACLEALYLRGKERGELSHRLSQRASAMLGLFAVRPLKAYTELSRGYEVRSTFVHGSRLEEDLRGLVPKLSQAIPEYSRVSLVTFMQLLRDPVDEEKERLLNRLDNSLLDEKALRKVKRLLEDDSLVIPL